MPNDQILQWKEYKPVRYPPDSMSDAVGNALFDHYKKYVDVEEPSRKTGGKWVFTPRGWVGTIPVTDLVVVIIQPKAPLANLFQMWEYAYRLKGFKFLDGVIECQSSAEFYQNLAGILANQVLDRARQGLYRTYLGREDRLPYLSGRLDIRRIAFEPWRTDFHCSYEEHTADVEENQILCWTLSVIIQSGLCAERILPKVRQAYRTLTGCTSIMPVSPKSCVGRLYNRLNDDYEPLHGLCRFFLEHRGPTHHLGDNAMMPFLMDMGRLYELFVAEWLKKYLPEKYELKEQHTVNFGSSDELQYRIDIVILDRETGTPLLVVDTKYKVPDKPSNSDINQALIYAVAFGCIEAVLVYPVKLPNALNVPVRNLRVRTLTFAVDGDIEQAGKDFLNDLLSIYLIRK